MERSTLRKSMRSCELCAPPPRRKADTEGRRQHGECFWENQSTILDARRARAFWRNSIGFRSSPNFTPCRLRPSVPPSLRVGFCCSARYGRELHVDRNLDLVTDNESARLECLVVEKSEVPPIEPRLRAESDTRAAPRIHDRSFIRDAELELARYVADCDVTEE